MKFISIFTGSFYIIFNYFMPLLLVMFPTSMIGYLGRLIGVLMFLLLLVDYKNVLNCLTFKFLIYVFFVVIVLSLSIFINIDIFNPALVFLRIYEVFSCLLAVIFFMNLCTKENLFYYVINIFAFCAICNSLVAIYGSFTGSRFMDVSSDVVGFGAFGFDPETGRSGGIRGENYAGVWNAPAIIYGLWLLLSGSNNFKRVMGLFSFSVGFVGVLVSLSRGSLLASALMIILFLFLQKKFFSIIKFLVFAFALIFISISSFFILKSQMTYVPESTTEFLHDKWSNKKIFKDSRIAIWSSYVQEMNFTDYFFGKGPGFIEKKIKLHKAIPHNSFIDILVEHGILGFILFVTPFFAILHSIFFCKSLYLEFDSSRIAVSLFCGMTVTIIFLSNPFLKILWSVYGVLLGSLVVNRRAS